MKNVHLYKKQQGLSIVELMVALAVGMVLIAGIMQVFLASKNTYAVNEAMSRVQENGRFALEFIARSARQAGYVDPNNKVAKPYPVIPSGTLCDFSSKACTSDGEGFSADKVSFAFQPPVNNSGDRVDCIGNTSDIDASDKIIINKFIIGSENTANATLTCQRLVLDKNLNLLSAAKYANEASLVEGVDKIQIQYGISTTTSDLDSKSVNQYVSADRVTDWGKVLAVRIAVLANSGVELNPAPTQKKFYLFDAGPFEFPDDRKLRQVFTTTVSLRNHN